MHQFCCPLTSVSFLITDTVGGRNLVDPVDPTIFSVAFAFLVVGLISSLNDGEVIRMGSCVFSFTLLYIIYYIYIYIYIFL